MDVNCYKHINLEYMEMMSDGDDSMKKIMLEMLLEELPLEIQKMEALALENDLIELGSVSHKLKSTLAFVGNDEMTNANKQIETLSKDKENAGIINEMIQTLKSAYPNIILELKQELERI